METLQNNIKYFSTLRLFIRYFVVVGCTASFLNNLCGPTLAIFHFIFLFLVFIDEDIIDPEEPAAIEDIGKPLNFNSYAT